jgi:hypothetical protein
MMLNHQPLDGGDQKIEKSTSCKATKFIKQEKQNIFSTLATIVSGL